MSDSALLTLGDATYDLPIIEGSEHERAVDIGKLRAQSGYISLDPGFVNTGSCRSAITFIDGEKGILRYRGIPIEQLAAKATFVETSYLLIYGNLPNRQELKNFSNLLTMHSMIHEDMKNFCNGYPMSAHPMSILSSMVCNMTSYYPEVADMADGEVLDVNIARLISKIRTIAAFSYKKSIGQPFIYPRNDLKYPANFLYMMSAVPAEPYEVNDTMVRALNTLLILHADHEQNCSTSTVRLVGSSRANLFASVAAGILALWGPLHGGANQAVIEMLERILEDGGNVKKYVDLAKGKTSDFRLMGFGHRVYKNFDPRANVIKKNCDEVLKGLGVHDPLLDIAMQLEDAALHDDYFIERKLYPNVDFYSGILYKAMGIPTNMFTVMFAIGRLPGWIAHWKEMLSSPDFRIGRPRQIYTGENARNYVPLDQRS